MTNQGRQRNTPPVCHGNGGNPDGNDHCCYVAGEVCPHLEENTVPGRRWACGLFRQTKAQFANQTPVQIWSRVQRAPAYAPVRAEFERVGAMLCGDFLGTRLPDGTIEGQCCFAGYRFDANGNVI